MLRRRSAAGAALLLAALAGSGLAIHWRNDARASAAETAFPPEGRFVEVDGRRVHYVQAGSGPDLVLIHGASGSTRDWTFDFVHRVSDRYRVTVFDRPGLGYTDPDPEFARPFRAVAEGPASQADLLHRASEKIGIESEIVVGHSYGGAVALAWALDHDPAALVVVSGASQPWEGGLGPRFNLLGSAIGGGLAIPVISAFVPRSMIAENTASVFAPQVPPEGYIDAMGVPLTLRPFSLRSNIRQVNTLAPHLSRMSGRYGDLDLPVEIVHGTADGVVPYDIHSETTAREIPNAHLTLLDGVGHMVHHVDPAAIVAAIDRAAERTGMP